MKNALKEGVKSGLGESLKVLEKQREMFLNTLLHDIKNPLLAQIEGLKLLKAKLEALLNEEQKEILDLSLESSQYMQKLLLSVLTIYKFENGVITLQKQPFMPALLVQNCIREILPLAKTRGVTILLSAEEFFIYADEVQIRRVITNLLINAVSYCHKNTQVELKIMPKDANAVFSFENFSPKISDEVAKNMFKKFVSNSSGHQKLSTGLGMYLSKKIVEAHGGEISLETKNEWNRFSFKLPLDTQKGGRVVFD